MDQEELAHLVAKPFDVGLRELFALAKLCDPAVYFVLHDVLCAYGWCRRKTGAEVVDDAC